MVLRKRRCIVLVLFILFCTSFCYDDGSSGSDNKKDSSDDEAELSQALALVHLLKKEYIRALRANVEQQIVGLVGPTEEMSTCASTINGYDATTTRPTVITGYSNVSEVLERKESMDPAITWAPLVTPPPQLAISWAPLATPPPHLAISWAPLVTLPPRPAISWAPLVTPPPPAPGAHLPLAGGRRVPLRRRFYDNYDAPNARLSHKSDISWRLNDYPLPYEYIPRRRVPEFLYYDLPYRRFVPQNHAGDGKNTNVLAPMEMSTATERLNKYITQSIRPIPKYQKSGGESQINIVSYQPQFKSKETNFKNKSKRIREKENNIVSVPIERQTPNTGSTNKTTEEISSANMNQSVHKEATVEPALDNRSNTTTEDPIQSQIQLELANELKKPVTYNQREIMLIKNDKMKRKKGTTRIYMARSTKLQVPLSENNAFCFYEPNSPLCRTP